MAIGIELSRDSHHRAETLRIRYLREASSRAYNSVMSVVWAPLLRRRRNATALTHYRCNGTCAKGSEYLSRINTKCDEFSALED